MEEGEYKATYDEIASNRCVFEKALTNQQCRCRLSNHFWLADREGYACKSRENAAICSEFLKNMRKKSRFLFKSTSEGEPLPHNMEIRVQSGGVKGLQLCLNPEAGNQKVDDISQLLEEALQRYDTLEGLPYSDIVQSVAQHQVRKRSRSKKQ